MSRISGPPVKDLTIGAGDSFIKLLLQGIEEHGDHLAMIDAFTEASVMFRDLLQNCKCISAELCSRGVGEGDVIVVCCEQNILAYTVLFGAMFTGATVALIPTSSAAMIHKLAHSRVVKAVFCDPKHLVKVHECSQLMYPRPDLVASVSAEDPVMASLLESTKHFKLYQIPRPDQHVPIVLFSSGTTGDPKAIPMCDSTLYKMCMRPVPMKRYLSLSPMYWFSGLMINITCMINKQTVVICNYTCPEDILRFTDKYEIDVWFLSIRALTQLLKCEQKSKYNLSSLKAVMTGGEVLTQSVAKAFIEHVLGPSVKFYLVMGTTEGGGVAVNVDVVNLIDPKNRAVSCGKPFPGVTIKVMDEEGNVVPLGQEGEIWIKTSSLTSGYWNNPEMNKSAFDEEGFIRTGDHGYIDCQGNLFNLGRILDLITCKGIKVPSSAAEDMLLTHPDVLEAAVVGTPDSQGGQFATAFVVKKPGSTITEDQMASLVNSQLNDSHQLRGGVHFRESLPRLDVGKVIKKLLRHPL